METQYLLLAGIVLLATALNSLILFAVVRRHPREAGNKPRLKSITSQANPEFHDALGQAEWQARVQKRVDEQIEHFLQQFAGQLSAIGLSINQRVSDSTGQLLKDQISESQKLLEQIHQAAGQAITQIQQDLEQKRLKLEQDLKQQVESERAVLLDKLERHTSEVVSSYLVESLGNQVDLGAQMPYILAQLEKDKEAIKEEITGGA